MMCFSRKVLERPFLAGTIERNLILDPFLGVDFPREVSGYFLFFPEYFPFSIVRILFDQISVKITHVLFPPSSEQNGLR